MKKPLRSSLRRSPSSSSPWAAGSAGLAGWTHDDFETALREGTRPDGTAIVAPMTFVTPYAANMTDVEMRALWTYLQSLPPTPTG